MHPLRWPRDPCYCVGNAEHRGRVQDAVHETHHERALALEVEPMIVADDAGFPDTAPAVPVERAHSATGSWKVMPKRVTASSPGRRIAIVRHHRADLTPPTGTGLTASDPSPAAVVYPAPTPVVRRAGRRAPCRGG